MRFTDSTVAPRPLSRRVFLLYLLLALWLCPVPAGAQQTLADGDWFEREIGAGVVWRHYLFDNLFGGRQSISYIAANLSDPNVEVEFPYLANARQRISTMAPEQFPDSRAAVNGTYFATTGDGGHLTYLRINNTEIPPGGGLFSPWGYEGAIAMDPSGATSIEQIPSGGWGNNSTHPDILACGPLVMVDGTVPAATLNAIGAHCTNRHPRTAVGNTADNRLILLVVDGRTNMSNGMTCEELGLTMEQLGCEDALNLDGGGSSTVWGAGEQYNGVLNYPSDNGTYDHLGERACSNAIAVVSAAPAPVDWDARLTGKTFSNFMANGSAQTVTLQYQNIGTGTWTSADTAVVVARPTTRTSVFQDSSWHSTAQPAVMTPTTVAPGETATFSFTLQAPTLATNALFEEHFMLTRSGVGRIGPADSEAWMRIAVQLPVEPEMDFIVESRPGGHNWAWYSDSGMANTSINCTATGCSPDIGTRYGSTYRSVAGSKKATVAPDFPADGFYKVYVAWGAGSNRRSPITYHVSRPGTTHTIEIDQTATANTWVPLAAEPFFFEEDHSGSVVMTNENIDVSGNMLAGAVKLEYVPAEAPEKSYDVVFLGGEDSKPVVDGVAGPGEWDEASPAGSGFVNHDNPQAPAAEDGAFRMLFDDNYLYILFTMSNAYLPAYVPPTNPYGFSDLAGDAVDFFLTPHNVNRQRFYRLMFSPNPVNGTCYVWSQASVFKTTNANVGTDWEQRGGAAYSYTGNALTIEYRIPWAEFDYPGIEVAGRPDNGTVWGVQPAISNRLDLINTEYVNWEPDDTGSFVYGEPFGALQFQIPTSDINDWVLY